jgi:1-acyl-sn-glycerol-3-phosphate acyltransferase
MIYLRSAIFFLFMFVSVIVWAIPSMLLFPFPFELRYKFISQWARMNVFALKVICGLTYEVQGRENIPNDAAVIICKHQSTWETLALQCIFPQQVWVLKRELLRIPFFGWGLAMLEPIAINRSARKQAMQQVIDQGTKRLQDGRWVVVFPEGTRIAPGKMGKFKLGGARLALAAKRSVVPVAHNAGEFWPKHSFLKHPGKITVVIGEPIYPDSKSPEEVNEMLFDFISGQMDRITTLKNTN